MAKFDGAAIPILFIALRYLFVQLQIFDPISRSTCFLHAKGIWVNLVNKAFHITVACSCFESVDVPGP